MSTSHLDGDTTQQTLEVEFEINPPESCSCGVGDVDGEVIDIQRIRIGEDYYTDLTISSSGDCCPESEGGCVIHRRNPVHSDCPFRAFHEEGWIPRIVRVGDDFLRVQTYLPDREALSILVDVLERTGDTIQVRKLRQINQDTIGTDSNHLSFDLDGLTEKQRLAAVRAVESGYYDRPRKTSLADLANEIGISKSGLSQRLNAVEAKLMKTVFSDAPCN